MEKRFKDRQMAKEVVEVIKTIPESEPILCYVYKNAQPYGGTDYGHILKAELGKAGLNPDRVSIDTFGNETSLNSYSHCQHVFLVGILHRSETELVGQYLGQIRDISGEINKELSNDLCLSERAHLAYQALSRGSCRFSDNGQARPMKGYIVEIDPGIEEALTTVMPEVTWSNWKPAFLPETDSLVEQVQGSVEKFLETFEGDRISSQQLKKTMKLDAIAPRTWTRVMEKISHASKEKEFVRGGVCFWRLHGRSLVRISAESFGFAVAAEGSSKAA